MLKYQLHVPVCFQVIFFLSKGMVTISFENLMSNYLQIRATGGLLKYLEKMRIGIELEDASVRVPVMDLKVVTL